MSEAEVESAAPDAAVDETVAPVEKPAPKSKGRSSRTKATPPPVEEETPETATVVEPETTEEEPQPEPEVASEAEAASDAEADVATDVPVKPSRPKRKPVRAVAPEVPASAPAGLEVALSVQGLTKFFGDRPAVDGIDLEVAPGSFYGIVGPNGAGKTTTLSMITGLLRPDAGVVRVFGLDVWHNATLAKRKIGVLPDRLRLFDRLTGAEFLHHAGALRGLDRATIAQRSADLSAAFGLDHSLHRLVSDYSAGMTKKIAIAAAMIHAPRLLVLDEPFESVDPVSTAVVLEVLTKFTQAGGTVILSSHSMELTERVCDAIAIIADGQVLASGPLADVLEGRSLEERFVELAGGEAAVEGMEWLQNFSD
ncbi:ABC transporter ATP-binding protein [Protaetiibacter sp. SSC-01]|nr:ABC transporter ATP-binding protein [Protaetiibacter sp. SSC-01]